MSLAALPGDYGGFFPYARQARDAGHLTRPEWLHRIRLHGLLVRADVTARARDTNLLGERVRRYSQDEGWPPPGF